ncbi:hypothetical protein PIB30_004767 [Stylosanthes scabra]|uniref:Aminopeptidase P N-terminal domain-containing protein n=1 Tax=Stylosanthes scabra TaxID=79078 RepID=A0ABU6T3K7_9FABA|nr:hypothetical protein [Stylosanthes scabra]
MQLHVGNRQKLLESLRHHLSQSTLPLRGQEQTRHGTDHLELFRKLTSLTCLLGVGEPGFYGAIDFESGESILFAPRLPDVYAVSLGEIEPLSYFKEHYVVSTAFFTNEIASVFLERYKGPGKP